MQIPLWQQLENHDKDVREAGIQSKCMNKHGELRANNAQFQQLLTFLGHDSLDFHSCRCKSDFEKINNYIRIHSCSIEEARDHLIATGQLIEVGG